MIFLKLFLIFSYIGLFNFGGGYAMISFINQEIVEKMHWLSDAEFTDIVAISQMTPGPIGINCATYVGYTSVINDAQMQALFGGESMMHILGILGSLLATFSILWLPFAVMIMVSKLILKHKNSIVKTTIFKVLRPAIIGLLASAALGLMSEANFGPIHNIDIPSPWSDGSALWSVPSVHAMIQVGLSILIFLTVFIGSRRFKWNLIYTTLACGFVGFIVYGILGL